MFFAHGNLFIMRKPANISGKTLLKHESQHTAICPKESEITLFRKTSPQQF